MTKAEADLYLYRTRLMPEQTGSYPANLTPGASIEVVFQQVAAPVLRELWSSVYSELPIVQFGTEQEAWERFLGSLADHPRLDIYLYIGQNPKGYACIVLDYDMHCGWCWSVQWHYVHKEYRGSSLSRKVIAILQELSRKTGIPYAYSQMQDRGTVKITYRGLN